MGSAARVKPRRLSVKLKAIREALALSQTEIWKRLGLEEQVSYKVISGYETGTTEPPLLVLLAYAKLANVWVDYLIDDAVDLPERLPSAVRRKTS